MHIITVSVTSFFNKNTALKDFKEGFVNRIREKQKNKKKKILRKTITFFGYGLFWVDR